MVGDKSLLKAKDPVWIRGPVYKGKKNSVGQSSVAVCIRRAHGTCSRRYANSHRVTARSGRGVWAASFRRLRHIARLWRVFNRPICLCTGCKNQTSSTYLLFTPGSRHDINANQLGYAASLWGNLQTFSQPQRVTLLETQLFTSEKTLIRVFLKKKMKKRAVGFVHWLNLVNNSCFLRKENEQWQFYLPYTFAGDAHPHPYLIKWRDWNSPPSLGAEKRLMYVVVPRRSVWASTEHHNGQNNEWSAR